LVEAWIEELSALPVDAGTDAKHTSSGGGGAGGHGQGDDLDGGGAADAAEDTPVL
jgi:hypothetical protein